MVNPVTPLLRLGQSSAETLVWGGMLQAGGVTVPRWVGRNPHQRVHTPAHQAIAKPHGTVPKRERVGGLREPGNSSPAAEWDKDIAGDLEAYENHRRNSFQRSRDRDNPRHNTIH
ncbi:hypothetical protein CYMTET_8025 [Cymbomonas tetramitiformis]|uniref:Uncharacterized protein n=1 Tax=Cymbomonas tetramitiformis TaxID=36881 RepID=A0AAE0GTV0_9CHLO|nr:hypothetical protein CYMTET_8025 [Cymbomonas tetramitiformis]